MVVSVLCYRELRGFKSISPPLLLLLLFVVWFLWNNLIKVAGWLNSERKLDYICLSFPLKSFSHPATLLLRVVTFFIIFSLFERKEKTHTHTHIKYLPLSHYFHNYSSGCQKIRPNHNQKPRKMLLFDQILIWQRHVVVSSTRLKYLIPSTAAFKGVFHL